jgi:protoheme ferro-lyase
MIILLHFLMTGGDSSQQFCCLTHHRIPLHYLEERDGYFTEVKTTIERIVKQNNTPVVILAHSMGNRVTHYFLNWIKQKFGEEWIKQHVHTFFAVGAPWLGNDMTMHII